MTIPPPDIVSPSPSPSADTAPAGTEIAILRHSGAQATAVHGLADLFAYAEHYAREQAECAGPFLRVSHRIPGAREGEITCEVAGRSAPDAPPAIVVVPATQAGPMARGYAASCHAWLRHVHAGGAVLTAVCGGVFVLADAGLLSGRRVTTHWMFAGELARRHPEVKVDAARMLVDDGDLVTAGGVLAWVDLGLALVDRLLGREVMFRTARFMNAEPPRVEQRIYGDFAPPLLHGDGSILGVQHWMHSNLAAPLAVAALADRAGLGARTFLRRFVRATGMKPGDYHRRLRIARGRELLAFTRDPVERVAAATGYDDPAGFRRIFKRVVGLSPAEYRKRFQRTASAASPSRAM
jgi:transcriptional regulator GlxA family with amidase domain